MDPLPVPPPLPAKKNGRVWLVVVIVLGLILFAAFVGTAVQVFTKVKKKSADRDAALADMQRATSEERQKIAESLEKGEAIGGGDSINRIQQQMEKSAALMSKDDAAVMRGMSSYLAKMQAQARTYEEALAKFLKAEVLAFKVTDRSTLTEYRKIVTDFAVANDRLTDTIRRGEQLVREELAAVHVPDRTIEATVVGFNRGREQRQMQIRIRECDHDLGEASLAAIDLLDKNWGKWSHDPAGQMVFQNTATMEIFNELMKKVQKAGAEQSKAQQELAQKMKAAAPAPGGR